jgi:hypothetical protein
MPVSNCELGKMREKVKVQQKLKIIQWQISLFYLLWLIFYQHFLYPNSILMAYRMYMENGEEEWDLEN